MSTNDDSASRRGRRADQSEPDWRAHNRRPGDRWDQPSSGNRDNLPSSNGRDNGQGSAYSGYMRPSYPQPRPEQAPQNRPYDAPQTPQGYYQEPGQRPEPPRSYTEPALPVYNPPAASYPAEPQLPSYSGTGRDDPFSRDPVPPGYDQNPYGSQSGYQPSGYDATPSRVPFAQPAAPADYYRQTAPAEDYERGFGARITPPDNAAPRFFLPDEQPQASQQWTPQPYGNAAPQGGLDRGFGSGQAYQAGGYDSPAQSFGQGQFDPRYGGQEAWPAEEQAYRESSGGLAPIHGDEFDEDFFGDEEDFEDDQRGGKGSRKKLIAAAVAAAVVAAGGGFAYKTMMGGGDKATPFIRADNRPSKETPGNPGGRQFPNGEKAIYERLTPDGQTQIAPAAPPVAAIPGTFAQPDAVAASGNSLDDRIEEALKRAQRSGDAPPAAAQGRTSPDQPTVVRSEIYRPDGTRVDGSRPMIQPQFSNVNQGSLPPPFGNGPAMQPAAVPPPPPPAQPIRTAAAPQTQFATAPATLRGPAPKPAEPAVPPAGAFYVSLKSAPDEKAIQRDVPVLTDKYKSVLGEVQISSKIADLGSKGVTYRAVAGPLGSRQEAMELCQKIKGVGGDKACFVTN